MMGDGAAGGAAGITGIHHLNFLVRDLGAAVEKHRRLLGVEPMIEDLPGRGVTTARFRVGETWLVLVQPTGPSGVPARHLAKHGEGCFLISYRTESLEDCLDVLEARGVERPTHEARHGIDGWRVLDLYEDGSVIIQVAEEG